MRGPFASAKLQIIDFFKVLRQWDRTTKMITPDDFVLCALNSRLFGTVKCELENSVYLTRKGNIRRKRNVCSTFSEHYWRNFILWYKGVVQENQCYGWEDQSGLTPIRTYFRRLLLLLSYMTPVFFEEQYSQNLVESDPISPYNAAVQPLRSRICHRE